MTTDDGNLLDEMGIEPLPHYHDEGRDECPACADREIRRGEADYRRWKDNTEAFGEEYATAEELAWELKDPT